MDATVKAFVAWLEKRTPLPTPDSNFIFLLANRPNRKMGRQYTAQVQVNGIPKYSSTERDMGAALNGLALKVLEGQEDQ